MNGIGYGQISAFDSGRTIVLISAMKQPVIGNFGEPFSYRGDALVMR